MTDHNPAFFRRSGHEVRRPEPINDDEKTHDEERHFRRSEAMISCLYGAYMVPGASQLKQDQSVKLP